MFETNLVRKIVLSLDKKVWDFLKNTVNTVFKAKSVEVFGFFKFFYILCIYTLYMRIEYI